jgi:hypothetical protein
MKCFWGAGRFGRGGGGQWAPLAAHRANHSGEHPDQSLGELLRLWFAALRRPCLLASQLGRDGCEQGGGGLGCEICGLVLAVRLGEEGFGG